MVSAKKVPAIATSFGVSFALLHILCLEACLNESPGQNPKEEKLCPENFTRILDSLLDGYDNRLRPGFGGMNDFKRSSVSCLSLSRSACLSVCGSIIRYASRVKLQYQSIYLPLHPTLPSDTPSSLSSPKKDLWQEDRPQTFPAPAPSEALLLPHTNYLPGT
uniref:Gamma-aminobutyric acid type A receptor subunit alpha4 n=1 Tax=Myotis myotis TaxID=51298 RepID=A0A7J8AJX2_MYOMY|nr:gamma-aminobutyric acid type A receptor subunit alpha4 [Myotis myotis]